MNTQEHQMPRRAGELAVLFAIGMLWLQLFAALIPVWLYGQYYDYGWLVPPIAAAFVTRRWSMGCFHAPAGHRTRGDLPKGVLVVLGLGTFAFLAALRIVEVANADWRPPLIVHAVLVTAASHLLLLVVSGWRASLALFPVTIFALSAVPYPGRAETALISGLTDHVVSATTEIFHLSGLPVEQVGNKLALNNEVVEVAEGCSGIRSLQSLIMAGLFFGEFMLLSWRARIAMLGVAASCAFVLNIVRAYWLARVHFFEGAEREKAVHELAGHLAFGASAAILLIVGTLIRKPWGRRTVTTVVGEEIA